MVAEAAFRVDFSIRFRQLRVFSNAQDRTRRMHNAATVPQVVLTVGMATSAAALAGVADLKL